MEFHPVQVRRPHPHKTPKASTTLTLAAYEVYRHVYGAQEALVTGNCRGGFGVSELVALLYARSFPKEEWRRRVDEALEGIEGF